MNRLAAVADHIAPRSGQRCQVGCACQRHTATAGGAASESQSGADHVQRHRAVKPEIIFNTDARHSSIYLYEPPMSERKYVEPIDEVLDLGVDTISYTVGDCSVLLYDTKVGERWGHNHDLINHEVWHRAAQNCAAMIESGRDPLRVVCDHAHSRGMNFLAHLLLGLFHKPASRTTDGRQADFTTAHPDWQIGPESLDAVWQEQFGRPTQLSYAVSNISS
jgi:hypothetical protein